jgi:hypothetical protein
LSGTALKFWIEVQDEGEAFVAVVHELIVHDQVSGRFVYDVRFTTARHPSAQAAYEAAEQELQGYLAQLARAVERSP